MGRLKYLKYETEFVFMYTNKYKSVFVFMCRQEFHLFDLHYMLGKIAFCLRRDK